MSIVHLLILANLAGFLLELGMAPEDLSALALWPLGAGFMPWQPVTHAFLHAGFAHLAVNMFGLWMFGRDVEAVLGKAAMCKLYILSVLSAALAQLLVAAGTGTPDATVGASGGVFGVLLAYAMYFPQRVIVLLFPPIPLPAWLFVSLYALVELALGVLGADAGVAHFGHLGGMAGAYLMLRRRR